MSGRVLVTGSEGFTGRYVCEALASDGWEVWGAGSQLQPDNPHYLHIDLLRPETLLPIVEVIRPDVVIHLAASAFVAEQDPTIFYRVNLIGTRHLLDILSASETPPACTVLASSANVYGNANSEILNENEPLQPANDYAVSKLAMEYLAKTYMDRLGIVITRPFNYTGIGQSQRFLIPKIVTHFRANAPVIELGNLDVAREFCDVRDIAGYYRELARVQPCGNTVNLCSGQTHTLTDVLEMASDITGHQLDVQVNPAFVRPNEVKRLCGDASKLAAITGKTAAYQLADTLGWMLAVD